MTSAGIPRRNITTKDEITGNGPDRICVRRCWEDGDFTGAIIYRGGWKFATVKTERGIASAVNRAKKEA